MSAFRRHLSPLVSFVSRFSRRPASRRARPAPPPDHPMPLGVRVRPRSALLGSAVVIGILAVVLQGCEVIPGPVQIKIADPSPTVANSTTFSFPGYQSPSGRALSVASSRDGRRVYV